MILCLGTTPVFQRTMVFDRVATDRVNRAVQVSDYASGKSINVAWVIHTLGRDVIATGFAGGSRGEALCRDLDRAGIPHNFVRVAPETRQCVTVIDRSAGTATELVEESSSVGPEGWKTLENKLMELIPKSKLWVFSGTLAPDAAKDFYARWLPLAQQHDARVIVDVVGEPLRLAMAHPNAILKMNRDELAITIGQDLSDDSALVQAMLAHAPLEGLLVVTLGAGGAIASDGRQCWRAASPKITPVSAVGSGDSFAAGLAVALSEGRKIADAMKLAIACGAANALTPLAGHVDRETVERLQTQVVVIENEPRSSSPSPPGRGLG
jgi:tagatose 6-phosphate kinase